MEPDYYSQNLRVWMHIKTAQLGYANTATMFGTLWFFEEHKLDEVLNPNFVNFIDDPRDPISMSSSEFEDLGPL